MSNNILFVGGTFDENGGKASSLVEKIANFIKKEDSYFNLSLYNGGAYSDLSSIIEECAVSDFVLWWANVPNGLDKIRDVKTKNHRAILVTSKRNDNEKYSFMELVNHALGLKANLCVEFSKIREKYRMRLFDPLGNVWYQGYNIEKFTDALLERMVYLKSIHREATICKSIEDVPETPDESEFFEIVRKYADVFHDLIMPAEGVTRFLGNSSFRCTKGGFPSFKCGPLIYVSRRNVDKRFIDKDAFVPAYYSVDNCEPQTFYYGPNKPSVDTPIQVRLYNRLPFIKYMIHSHVYIENAPFTERMVPCGGLAEVGEIMKVINKNAGNSGHYYAINLKGHGSIVMASDVAFLKHIPYTWRPLPEMMCEPEVDYE